MASNDDIATYADRIHHAVTELEHIQPLTDETDLTVDDAYDIQDQVIEQLLGDAGAIVGYKLGLVSGAKQEQLGIDEPIYCPVPEQFLLDDVLDLDTCLNPRLEAEIGLVLDSPLEPPVTATDVLTSTGAVVPVVEIIESRFEGWRIPTAEDVIADITSGRRVVVGDQLCDVRDVDLAMESVTLTHNGELVETGVGADIMGNPARGVAWLAERLSEDGATLGAGDLIMTGGITAAVDIEANGPFEQVADLLAGM